MTYPVISIRKTYRCSPTEKSWYSLQKLAISMKSSLLLDYCDNKPHSLPSITPLQKLLFSSTGHEKLCNSGTYRTRDVMGFISQPLTHIDQKQKENIKKIVITFQNRTISQLSPWLVLLVLFPSVVLARLTDKRLLRKARCHVMTGLSPLPQSLWLQQTSTTLVCMVHMHEFTWQCYFQSSQSFK